MGLSSTSEKGAVVFIEALISLCGEKKTQERIAHKLKTGKQRRDEMESRPQGSLSFATLSSAS
jgi:hypothetical protein